MHICMLNMLKRIEVFFYKEVLSEKYTLNLRLSIVLNEFDMVTSHNSFNMYDFSYIYLCLHYQSTCQFTFLFKKCCVSVCSR